MMEDDLFGMIAGELYILWRAPILVVRILRTAREGPLSLDSFELFEYEMRLRRYI